MPSSSQSLWVSTFCHRVEVWDEHVVQVFWFQAWWTGVHCWWSIFVIFFKQYYNFVILFWRVKLCEMLRTLLWICTLWISCDWLIVFVSPPGCVQLVVTALQHKTASEDIHRWTDTPWLSLRSVCRGQLVWKRGMSLLLASSPEVRCSFRIGWGSCMYVLMCYAQENESTYTNPVSSVCAPEF